MHNKARDQDTVVPAPTLAIGAWTYSDDVERLTLVGEIDMVTGPVLRRALTSALATGRDIEVHTAGVTFCDITGINILLDAASCAERSGRRFRCAAVPRQLARVLALTGASHLIDDPVRPG